MLNRHEIPFAHWSVKVGRIDPETGESAPVHGEIVSGFDDVDQAMGNLILTPKRSVPCNPKKGCDIEPYIDRHEAEAIPNITREIWDALALWEPRVIVDKVVVFQQEFVHFVAQVFWRPVQSVLDDEVRVTEIIVS